MSPELNWGISHSSAHCSKPPPRQSPGGWVQGPESRPDQGLGILFAARETEAGVEFQRLTAHTRRLEGQSGSGTQVSGATRSPAVHVSAPPLEGTWIRALQKLRPAPAVRGQR